MENNETEKKEGMEKKHARFRLGTMLFGVILVVGISFVSSAFLVVFHPDTLVATLLRRVLPFPVAVVDGAFISYRELDRDRESVRRFYESQAEALSERGFRVDFDTPEGKSRLLIREKDILNKLVEDEIIRSLAREKSIRFSDDEIERQFQAAIQKEGGSQENLEDRLKTLYGWDIETFQEKIIIPSLYRENLEKSFEEARDITVAKSAIEKASSALKDGESFEKVAETFSEGDSGKSGGDLGWVDIGTLVPELQNAAKTQVVNRVGPIIESSIGFHIVSVLERKTEGEKELAHLRQVFTRKPMFSDWLNEKKREKLVFIFPRRYIWDAGVGAVLFRDGELRSFEKRALEKSEGDPSLIF
jgi:parvulin-like peptidyl-prolyl isomerase